MLIGSICEQALDSFRRPGVVARFGIHRKGKRIHDISDKDKGQVHGSDEIDWDGEGSVPWFGQRQGWQRRATHVLLMNQMRERWSDRLFCGAVETVEG